MPAENYDMRYEAIAQSRVYREAVRTFSPDLPDWVIPYLLLFHAPGSVVA